MANLHFQLSWYNQITLLPPPTQHHSFFRNFHPWYFLTSNHNFPRSPVFQLLNEGNKGFLRDLLTLCHNIHHTDLSTKRGHCYHMLDQETETLKSQQLLLLVYGRLMKRMAKWLSIMMNLKWSSWTARFVSVKLPYFIKHLLGTAYMNEIFQTRETVFHLISKQLSLMKNWQAWIMKVENVIGSGVTTCICILYLQANNVKIACTLEITP